eukprot:scaffold2189_cov43-Prasinocladus_malaysianus.AAC.1
MKGRYEDVGSPWPASPAWPKGHIACRYSPKNYNIARGSPPLLVLKAKMGYSSFTCSLGRLGLRDRLGKLKVRLPAAAGRP